METTTTSDYTVECKLDPKIYQEFIKIDKELMESPNFEKKTS